MSHMVVFRSADGKPGYHQAETLDEAVRFVEHLRNQEGVTDTRLFRMQEIPLEVRTYYRVEVAPGPEAVVSTPVVEEAERAVGMVDDPVVVEPMPAGNGHGPSGPAAGRFNRFNRG